MPRLFVVPLGKGKALPDPSSVETLMTNLPDIDFPNLNGIETTPDRRALVVAHNVQGTLYRVDPGDGSASQVEIDHGFAGPDGMVRQGRRLYVVEPHLSVTGMSAEEIAEVIKAAPVEDAASRWVEGWKQRKKCS